MKCYYNDLKRLQKKLTFSEVQEFVSELRAKLYDAMFNPNAHVSYDDIIAPLEKIRTIIVEKFHGLYLADLDHYIDKVKIFKTHFANLDIRQDHSVHTKAVTQILQQNNFIKENLSELTEDELVDILLHKNLKIALGDLEEGVVRDTVKNIGQLQAIQEKNGEEGCNRYIISNSEDIFSVLFVYGLFRWSGWDANAISFDIVPLFETMDGMDGAEDTMQKLFNTPEYMAHVNQRGDVHTIMLGFSDGTKDGGYLKANWSILKTKESLSGVCAKNNIKAIFFDGRGGPPARGGGKTHRFYAAQTQGIANNEIQLTIQGQTITSTYGTKEQFVYNCEQLITAGLSNNLFGDENVITDDARSLIEELSELSFAKYDALKHHDKFMPYLENRSTLKYYGKANIGSRPGKRGNKARFTSYFICRFLESVKAKCTWLFWLRNGN